MLFLDEPTSGLDPLAAKNVRTVISNLKQTQLSIILCTHDLDEAEKLADDIVIIKQGTLVAHGTPAELRSRATNEAHVNIELASPFTENIAYLDQPATIRNLRVSEDGLHLRYLTTDPKMVNPYMHQQLMQMGVSIVSMAIEQTALEDIYISAMHNKTS